MESKAASHSEESVPCRCPRPQPQSQQGLRQRGREQFSPGGGAAPAWGASSEVQAPSGGQSPQPPQARGSSLGQEQAAGHCPQGRSRLQEEAAGFLQVSYVEKQALAGDTVLRFTHSLGPRLPVGRDNLFSPENRQIKTGTSLLSDEKWWCFYLVHPLSEGIVLLGSQSYLG